MFFTSSTFVFKRLEKITLIALNIIGATNEIPLELAISQVASSLSQYLNIPIDKVEEYLKSINSKDYNEILAVAVIALDDLIIHTLKSDIYAGSI